MSDRHRADEILENQAWEVFKSKNTGIKEKVASWLVTTAMKVKRKMGAGCEFKQIVSAAKNSIKNKVNEKNITKLVRTCLTAAKKSKKSKRTKIPRIIPISKKSCVLPLIPIFAGLSALGELTGGVANIVKVMKELNSGKNTPINLGKGLYLTPHKGSSYKIVKGQLFGFKNLKYDGNVKHESDALVNITKTNCIYIDSNLVMGLFVNGRQCHTIHEFYPNVPPGYKIIEVPTHLVFYPLNTTSITHASIILKNQDNDLINLRDEPVSIRLLIQDL
ncbi:hypothetical protein QTP88_010057 [Uroleucon formosanum]